MIPVALADEKTLSPLFDETVRKRGATAIQKLLAQPVKGRGRKPKTTYAQPTDIPGDKFPRYWAVVRKADGKSAIDDLMDAYNQVCAYLGMRIERATGSPTVDHQVPKERDWRLVYEWDNYRLSAGCVNGAKGTRDVVDPFKVQHGWFELDLDTFFVRRGAAAPAAEHVRIEETLKILNLRQCVAQRGDFITRYRTGQIDIRHIDIYAPFVAFELRRQELVEKEDV